MWIGCGSEGGTASRRAAEAQREAGFGHGLTRIVVEWTVSPELQVVDGWVPSTLFKGERVNRARVSMRASRSLMLPVLSKYLDKCIAQ